MARRPSILCGALLLAGCGDGAEQRSASPRSNPAHATAAVPSEPPVPDWDTQRCGDAAAGTAPMVRHPALIGRTAEALLAAYGKPQRDERFAAGEGVGTYRGGVASQLPGGAARNARTPVREIVWLRAGCEFIVRFRQAEGAWRVFDAFEAAAGADF